MGDVRFGIKLVRRDATRRDGPHLASLRQDLAGVDDKGERLHLQGFVNGRHLLLQADGKVLRPRTVGALTRRRVRPVLCGGGGGEKAGLVPWPGAGRCTSRLHPGTSSRAAPLYSPATTRQRVTVHRV